MEILSYCLWHLLFQLKFLLNSLSLVLLLGCPLIIFHNIPIFSPLLFLALAPSPSSGPATYLLIHLHQLPLTILLPRVITTEYGGDNSTLATQALDQLQVAGMLVVNVG